MYTLWVTSNPTLSIMIVLALQQGEQSTEEENTSQGNNSGLQRIPPQLGLKKPLAFRLSLDHWYFKAHLINSLLWRWMQFMLTSIKEKSWRNPNNVDLATASWTTHLNYYKVTEINLIFYQDMGETFLKITIVIILYDKTITLRSYTLKIRTLSFDWDNNLKSCHQSQVGIRSIFDRSNCISMSLLK